jgi:hypothetical protein
MHVGSASSRLQLSVLRTDPVLSSNLCGYAGGGFRETLSTAIVYAAPELI